MTAGAGEGRPGGGWTVMGARSISRDREKGMLGGVCAGIGSAYDVDATLVRLAFVVLALVVGAGIVLYAALWLLLPAAGRPGEDRSETAREGAAEMAEAARVASGHAVEASRVASGHAVAASRVASSHAVGASRAASVLIQRTARSAAAAVRERRSSMSSGGSASPQSDRPEGEKNSPSGPIP